MLKLRQKLKKETAPAHRALDEKEILQKYAQAACNKDEYLAVLRGFFTFYSARLPVSNNLGLQKYRSEYVAAIERDILKCGAKLPAPPPIRKESEISFFYLLLGSSMGAKVISGRYGQSFWPREHLEVAAQKGASLWKEFLKELEKVPENRHDEEVQRALRLFALLAKELPR